MRLIEATYPVERKDAMRQAIEDAEPSHFRIDESGDDGMCVARVFFSVNDAQEMVDRLQDICEDDKNWRILVLPVEATAPKLDEDDEERERHRNKRDKALREEVYEDVRDGATLTTRFFFLTVASAVVAAIGLNSDNVAAVIGAMVIAPLLGPILAVTFGVALGDIPMILRSGRNAVAGLATGIAAAVVVGLFMDVDYSSGELMRRTVVGVDSIAVALAAGAAAALSTVTGSSAALVGVMVAVALLPPAAAIGIFAGAERYEYALRAMLLLSVNVVCIMLASQFVYLWKQVRPRTWVEEQRSGRARLISFGLLLAILAAAVAIVFLTPIDTRPEDPGARKPAAASDPAETGGDGGA